MQRWIVMTTKTDLQHPEPSAFPGRSHQLPWWSHPGTLIHNGPVGFRTPLHCLCHSCQWTIPISFPDHRCSPRCSRVTWSFHPLILSGKSGLLLKVFPVVTKVWYTLSYFCVTTCYYQAVNKSDTEINKSTSHNVSQATITPCPYSQRAPD